MAVHHFKYRPSIPVDTVEDYPTPGRALVRRILLQALRNASRQPHLKERGGGPLELPVIIYGAGSFSNQYNTDDHLSSDIPLRTVRLALR